MKIGENLYVKIDNNATDKCYTQGDLGERKMKLNTKVREIGSLSKEGLNFAFQDVEAWAALISVKVNEKKSWSITENLALFLDLMTTLYICHSLYL